MAAVGYLAAGLAHEINNPTAFISSNLFMLSRYFDDFKKIMQAYMQLKREPVGEMTAQSLPSPLIQRCQAITDLEEEFDLDFILEDARKLVWESKQGARRIQKIVSDLKEFAQPGGSAMDEIEINSCVESALRFALNETESKPEVFKDFAENLKVQGNPQAIWLVFANLLLNAAQAVEGQGSISITTGTRLNGVRIRIQDSGVGIDQDSLGKIFDPFFTTKPVGQGAGLGLYMAYNAVSNHGGAIEVSSQVGVGTTFIIDLPFNTPEW